MTKPTQDKETLREAVARAIAETEGFDPAMDHIEGWYETADAAIATMFERLRTPCKECGGKGYAEIIEHWERPCDACRGKGYLAVPLTAFQRENSMTIKQKAPEIADKANRQWLAEEVFNSDSPAVIAARLGIIEGLEMAHQHLALVYLTNEATACEVYLEGLQDAVAAIRALIGEQKL